MDFGIGRNDGVDFGEELEKVLMPVTAVALCNSFAGGDIQSGEKRGYAVTLVVV
jgi:predicted NBD/HSP70 family sugar kinase